MSQDEQREPIVWKIFGKLKIGVTKAILVVKCPQCSRNIKVDKEKVKSIVM